MAAPVETAKSPPPEGPPELAVAFTLFVVQLVVEADQVPDPPWPFVRPFTSKYALICARETLAEKIPIRKIRRASDRLWWLNFLRE